jgi:hypothetical protein
LEASAPNKIKSGIRQKGQKTKKQRNKMTENENEKETERRWLELTRKEDRRAMAMEKRDQEKQELYLLNRDRWSKEAFGKSWQHFMLFYLVLVCTAAIGIFLFGTSFLGWSLPLTCATVAVFTVVAFFYSAVEFCMWAKIDF